MSEKDAPSTWYAQWVQTDRVANVVMADERIRSPPMLQGGSIQRAGKGSDKFCDVGPPPGEGVQQPHDGLTRIEIALAASTEVSSTGRSGQTSRAATPRRCSAPSSPFSNRAWPTTKTRSASSASAECARSHGPATYRALDARTVGWIELEVDEWASERIATSRRGAD